MADLTASSAAFNSGVTLTLNAAADSQTVDVSDVAGEDVVIVVRNGNTSEDQTATITVSPGDFQSKVLGTLSEVVAGNGAAMVIGPLEGVRFKTSASKLTVGVSVTASGTVSSVTLGVIKLP
jgi:hypothetical protein